MERKGKVNARSRAAADDMMNQPSLFPSSLLCKGAPKATTSSKCPAACAAESPLQHGAQGGARYEFCGHSMWWQEPSWLWSPQRLPGDLVIQRGSGQGEAGGQLGSKRCLFLASAHVPTTGESFTLEHLGTDG